ncbi:MAG: RIO1 family regulatory kinase/ATPase [Candidatus Heimdallarchaeota archaeon]
MSLSILKIFRQLKPIDFRVLSVVEILMAKYEAVPTEELGGYLNYTEKRILSQLNRLRRLKLLTLSQQHYLGTMLTFKGYDALALKALVERGVLAQIGPEIGAGKESNIHLAVNDDGHEFLVKFHRLGKLNFRFTKKARHFIADKGHLSPLYQSRLSAQREFTALSRLHEAGVKVPRPVGYNRHVVAMEKVIGIDLYRIKKRELEPEAVRTLIANIVEEVTKAVKLGFIHGDLSEYNIRLNEEGYPVLFDWPQYVEPTFDQAETILERDIQGIFRYFTRKYQIELSLQWQEVLADLKTILIRYDEP